MSAAHAAELELDGATHRLGLSNSPMRRHGSDGYEYDYRDSPQRNRDETPPRRRRDGQDLDEAWRQPSRLEMALASPVEAREPASPPTFRWRCQRRLYKRALSRPPTSQLMLNPLPGAR